MPIHNHPAVWKDGITIAVLILVGSAMLFGHVADAGAYSTDMAELSLCAWVGGVPHSPGYPLWVRLAEAALFVQGGADPIHALGRLSAVFAVLTALLTRSILRSFGVGVWASSAAALLLLVVPLFVRSFSIPEVHALDLFLLSLTIWCAQKGSVNTKGPWIALAWATVIIAIGHRPVNVILLMTIAFGFRHIQDRPKSVLGGLAIGVGMQGVLYADLWARIRDPATPWIDEHAATSPDAFFGFILGLPFEKFLSFSLIPSNFNLSRMGMQCLLLMILALLLPAIHRRSRIGWALMGTATWHVIFALFYQVGDREFFLFPVLWIGVLGLGIATSHVPEKLRNVTGVGFSFAVLTLAAINQNGLAKPGHEQWREPLRTTLQQVPPNAVLITSSTTYQQQLSMTGHASVVHHISRHLQHDFLPWRCQ